MMGRFVFSGFSMSWLEFYYFLHLQVQLRDLRANKSVLKMQTVHSYSPFSAFWAFRKISFLISFDQKSGDAGNAAPEICCCCRKTQNITRLFEVSQKEYWKTVKNKVNNHGNQLYS